MSRLPQVIPDAHARAVAQACLGLGINPEDLMRRNAWGGAYRGAASRVRAEVCWRLRYKYRDLGLMIQPSLSEIAAAVGYRAHTGVRAALGSRRSETTHPATGTSPAQRY